MRLQRLTGLEVEKINEELGFLTDQIAYFNLVLSNDEEVKKIIIKEITEIKDRYATPRLSELTYDYGDIDIEDLIEKEDVVISMTHGGYIKRMPVDEYRRNTEAAWASPLTRRRTKISSKRSSPATRTSALCSSRTSARCSR